MSDSGTYYRWHYEGIDAEGSKIHGYSEPFTDYHRRREYQRKGLEDFFRRDELWQSDILELRLAELYEFRKISDNLDDVIPQ